jgi:hypothetical protein
MRSNRTQFGLLAAEIVLLLFPMLSQAQLVATGVINGSLDHRGGISVLLMSDSNGVSLTGSSTPNASLSLGSVSMFGSLASGVSRTTTANSFTVSTPVDVYVDVGGISSTSFNLSAGLASAPGTLTYQFGTTTLSTTSTVLSQNDSRYATPVPYTLAITIPSNVAAGTISNTINFTAIAN